MDYDKRLIIIVQKTQDTAAIRNALAAIIAVASRQSPADEALAFSKAVRFERLTNLGTVFALGINLAITESMETPLRTLFLDTVTANRRLYEIANRTFTGTEQGQTRTFFDGQLLRVFTVVNSVQTVIGLDTLDDTIYASQPVTWQDIQDDLLVDFNIRVMQEAIQ